MINVSWMGHDPTTSVNCSVVKVESFIKRRKSPKIYVVNSLIKKGR